MGVGRDEAHFLFNKLNKKQEIKIYFYFAGLFFLILKILKDITTYIIK